MSLFPLFLSTLEICMADITALQAGYIGKVDYLVIDDGGLPISNVTVRTVFHVDGGKDSLEEGKTDEAGRFCAEGRSNVDCASRFIKDGYYDSFHRHVFLERDDKSVQDGKWPMQHDPFTIVMKQIKNPNRTRRKKAYIHSLKADHIYGFDFSAGALTHPDGSGEIRDAEFRFTTLVGPDKRKTSIIQWTFPGESAGMIRMAKDLSSEMRYSTTAVEEGYKQDISFSNDGGLPGTQLFPDGTHEYLAFKVERKGEQEITYHYGVIGLLSLTVSPDGDVLLSIFYFFNENPDDRNTEYTE